MGKVTNETEYIISLKDLFSAKIQQADNQAQHLNQTVEQTKTGFATLQTVALAAAAAIGYAFGQQARSIVDAGSEVETATIGLTTLLKDQNAAAQVIQNTMQDAARTPFEFRGLLMANRALISAGESAENSRQVVLDLANAIAATGGGNAELERMVVNMQQIKNVGKAAAIDIKQFAFAGINIYQALAEVTGKNVDELKDMDVTYDMLTVALRKAAEEGGIYANGLQNMSKSTAVAISNIGDAIFQLRVKIFNKMKPAIDTLTNGVKSLIGFTEQYIKSNQKSIMSILQFASSIAQGLMPVVGALGVVLHGVFKVAAGIADAWNRMGRFGQFLITTIGGIVVGVWAYNKALIAIKAAQAALLTIQAASAALMGNWAGLAAAGAILAAAGIYHLIDAHKELNKTKKEGENIKTLGAVTQTGKPTTSGAGLMTDTTSMTAGSTSKATSKPTVVNISINKLIETMVNNIQNAPKDLHRNIEEGVAKALLAAVNDTNRIAGALD